MRLIPKEYIKEEYGLKKCEYITMLLQS